MRLWTRLYGIWRQGQHSRGTVFIKFFTRYTYTVESRYNGDLGTENITLLHRVSWYIQNWDASAFSHDPLKISNSIAIISNILIKF